MHYEKVYCSTRARAYININHLKWQSSLPPFKLSRRINLEIGNCITRLFLFLVIMYNLSIEAKLSRNLCLSKETNNKSYLESVFVLEVVESLPDRFGRRRVPVAGCLLE